MRYLRQHEIDELIKLRDEGSKIKDIAKRFDVCEATVSNIVRGKYAPRRRKQVEVTLRSPYSPLDFKEEDFSSLPDDVLFQHVREWDFIG